MHGRLHEADERERARRLSDQRGRVKKARLTVSTTAGCSDLLRSDSKRAVQFYTRFVVSNGTFGHGVA